VQQAPKPVSQDEWHVYFTPYAWLPSTLLDITVPEVTLRDRTIGGDISINEPWWDVIGKLGHNFYVLSVDGRVEAWKGRWGGFFDGYWIFGKVTVSPSDSRLRFRDRIDVTRSLNLTSRFDAGQFNFGPQFVLGTAPLSSASSVSFVLYGGGRVNWIGNDVDGTLKVVASTNIGDIGRTFNFSGSKSRAFIEPMIGFKTMWALGPKFNAIVRGDVGGFGFVTANNWDCDLEAAVAYQVMRNTYLDLGYRARGQWQDVGSRGNGSVSGWFFGPELGMTFSF
jgi:hypothetical protein